VSDPASGIIDGNVLSVQEISIGNARYPVAEYLVYSKDKRKFFYRDKLLVSGTLYRPYNFAHSQRTNFRIISLASRYIF